MFRHARRLILILVAAAAGAVLGRWLAEARARVDRGEDPLAVSFNDVNVRPQDFVPGVFAAFRVGEPPWSWLHIPGWLAAFGLNFGTAVVGGDLERLRQTVEDRALSALGLQADDFRAEDVTPAPESPFAPPPPTEPAPPREPPPPATPASEPPSAGDRPVWTAENAAPSSTNGHNGSPSAETPGFTPLRD
jgi:hypothetical protein